ncbi:MAG: cell division protein SepF [Nitrososphaerota archaeon]|jgi:SepF-like predicted cell division protein (DUF552 family)|nr:cell division protein SepF [Nitrososphaerota archaeon]
MPSFGLFRKEKNQNNKSAIVTSASKEETDVAVKQAAVNNNTASDLKVEQSEVKEEVLAATAAVAEKGASVEGELVTSESSGVEVSIEDKEDAVQQVESIVDSKLYLKAIPLRDTLDLEYIKAEVEEGNILILRITPLASKSIEAVKSAVNELYLFTESIGGDIARLGEERVVICPKNVRIWREKLSFKKSEAS